MKYLINVEITEEVEADDAEEAKKMFMEDIENEPQQTISSWLEEQIVVIEIKEERKGFFGYAITGNWKDGIIKIRNIFTGKEVLK